MKLFFFNNVLSHGFGAKKIAHENEDKEPHLLQKISSFSSNNNTDENCTTPGMEPTLARRIFDVFITCLPYTAVVFAVLNTYIYHNPENPELAALIHAVSVLFVCLCLPLIVGYALFYFNHQSAETRLKQEEARYATAQAYGLLQKNADQLPNFLQQLTPSMKECVKEIISPKEKKSILTTYLYGQVVQTSPCFNPFPDSYSKDFWLPSQEMERLTQPFIQLHDLLQPSAGQVQSSLEKIKDVLYPLLRSNARNKDHKSLFTAYFDGVIQEHHILIDFSTIHQRSFELTAQWLLNSLNNPSIKKAMDPIKFYHLNCKRILLLETVKIISEQISKTSSLNVVYWLEEQVKSTSSTQQKEAAEIKMILANLITTYQSYLLGERAELNYGCTLSDVKNLDRLPF